MSYYFRINAISPAECLKEFTVFSFFLRGRGGSEWGREKRKRKEVFGVLTADTSEKRQNPWRNKRFYGI